MHILGVFCLFEKFAESSWSLTDLEEVYLDLKFLESG